MARLRGSRAALAEADIDLDRATTKLFDEGLATFRDSVIEVLATNSDARVTTDAT